MDEFPYGKIPLEVRSEFLDEDGKPVGPIGMVRGSRQIDAVFFWILDDIRYSERQILKELDAKDTFGLEYKFE